MQKQFWDVTLTTINFVLFLASMAMLMVAASIIEARAHEATASVQYPLICCSNRDCRPTLEGEVKQTPQGYTLTSTGETVPYNDRRIKPFEADGRIHVCQQAGDFDKGRILCLLVPPPSF